MSKTPKRITITIVGCFMVYVLSGLFGYGNDNDTYGILASGQNIFTNGIYNPSRFQGAFIVEVIVGITSLLGGHLATNLVSALLGAWSLFLFYALINEYFSNNENLIIIILVGLNPAYIISSSSTMDYIYGLFLLLLALNLLRKNYLIAAAIVLSFSLSARLSNAPFVVCVAFWVIYNYKIYKVRNIILSGLVGLVFLGVLYAPVFIRSKYNFSFLNYSIPEWGFFDHLSRFAYKNIYLFGLPGTLLIIFTLVGFLLAKKLQIPKCSISFSISALTALLLMELLFFKMPLEIYYLLPILLIVYPYWLQQMRSIYYGIALAIFTVTYNIFNIDILKIEYKQNVEYTEAISAKTGIFIEKGLLVEDLATRSYSQSRYIKKFPIRE